MHQLNKTQLFLSHINDMLAVAKGEKGMFDAVGEVTKEPAQMAYLVPQGKKIVMHNDEFYLINQNGNLGELDAGQQAAAKADFIAERPNMQAVKHVVKEHVSLEKEHVELKKAELTSKLALNKACQESTVEARKACLTAKEEFNASLKPGATPGMKPQQTNSVSMTAKEKEISSTVKIISYLHANETRLTPQYFRQIAGTSDNPEALKSVNRQLMQVPANGPIPHTTMMSMLQNLERFGVDATKANVTAIRNPRELQNAAKSTMQPDNTADSAETTDYESPTPLSTTPSIKPVG